MERRRAPGVPQRADLGQPERQVQLGGVADRAVDLQSRAGGQVGRIAARDLGRGDVLALGHDRGAEQQRPGEVEGDPHVGQLVLDRLVGPDLPAELATLLRVRDRVREQPFPGTQQLCRGGKHPEAQCAPELQDVDRLARRHSEQVPGPVDRTHPLAHRRGVQGVVVEDVELARDVGVECVRRERWFGERGDRPGQVPAECEGQHRGGLDPRAGDGVPTERLERDAGLDRRVLGRQLGHAELGQPRPQLQPGLVVAVGPGAGHRHRVCRGQE